MQLCSVFSKTYFLRHADLLKRNIISFNMALNKGCYQFSKPQRTFKILCRIRIILGFYIKMSLTVLLLHEDKEQHRDLPLSHTHWRRKHFSDYLQAFKSFSLIYIENPDCLSKQIGNTSKLYFCFLTKMYLNPCLIKKIHAERTVTLSNISFFPTHCEVHTIFYCSVFNTIKWNEKKKTPQGRHLKMNVIHSCCSGQLTSNLT